MRGFCWDQDEHERNAERDARYGRPDHDYYDRYTSDPCKEAYTERYDEEIRSRHRREEERERQAEEAEARHRAHQRQAELEREENYYAGEDFA